MNFNVSLYDIVKKSSAKYPSSIAIHYENKNLTYEYLINKIDLLASYLNSIGVKPKDVVTICMPNMPQAVYAFYAINKLGAIIYEVHPKTTCTQIKKYLTKSNSKYLLVIDIFAEKYISLINELDIKIITFNPFKNFNLIKKIYCDKKSPKKEVIRYDDLKVNKLDIIPYKWNPEEPSVLLNTGGTTGESKQIELSSSAINHLAGDGTEILGINDGRGVYMFAVLPMFHGFGLCMGIHAPLMYGAAVSLMMKFHTKDTIKLIKKNKLTILIGVPAIFKALLKNKKFYTKKLKNITVSYVGGDFVSQDLIESFNKVMTTYESKARLYEGYGLTETVTVCTVNTDKEHQMGSVGKAVGFAKLGIIDSTTNKFLKPYECGEIVVSGKILMNGYYQDEELNKQVFFTDENNVKWLKTGDYGYLDENDYLFFKQRLKRIVKISGVIICPSEIENVVSKLPEVHEVYATSIEHETKDHMIVLFVNKNRNMEITNESLTEKINDLVVEEVSIYAKPYKIIYMDEMPKTEIGKIDGKKLEENL